MRIVLSQVANKSIRKLRKSNPNAAKAIAEKIKDLANNPNPPTAKKIRGEKYEIWRIRAGDFRIIYYFEGCNLIIIVFVGPRKSVYEDFKRLEI